LRSFRMYSDTFQRRDEFGTFFREFPEQLTLREGDRGVTLKSHAHGTIRFIVVIVTVCALKQRLPA